MLGKGGRRKAVPLAGRTVDALDTYLAGRTVGPLIPDATGKGVTRHTVTWIVGKVARRALPAELAALVVPHALGATFITRGLDAGVPLHRVQDDARHRDPKTAQRYNRQRDSLDGHATYRLAEALSDLLKY